MATNKHAKLEPTFKDSTFEEMKVEFPSTVYKYRRWNKTSLDNLWARSS